MLKSKPIYLDCHATTLVDPRVFDVMRPFFCEKFGNTSSAGHSYGWQAKSAVDNARETLVQAIGGKNLDTILFTSGTTESNNLALKGVVESCGVSPAHIITQKTEHECVLESLRHLQTLGHEVTFLDVDEFGRVRLNEFRASFRKNTVLVSIMWANNEIGTIQNIPALLAITREHPGVLFHTDAAQAVGRIAVDVSKVDVDLMSFSAHKMYGPKGVGALYVADRKPRLRLTPQMHGGGHEKGLRSGTLNVPAIVGFACALELCVVELEKEKLRLTKLRDEFAHEILNKVDLAFLNGPPVDRLPNNLSLTIPGVSADELMFAVPEVAFSTGAACSSGGTEPSYVIQAIGRSRDEAKSTIRLGLGRFTTTEEIHRAAQLLVAAIRKLRAKSVAYEMLRR